MFIISALSNMGIWNLQKRNQLCNCASALSCSNMWNSRYPHRHINVIALHILVAVAVKLQKFVIREPNFSPS